MSEILPTPITASINTVNILDLNTDLSPNDNDILYFTSNILTRASMSSYVRDTLLDVSSSDLASEISAATYSSSTDNRIPKWNGTSTANTTNSISSYTTLGAIEGFIKIKINSANKWMPYYGNSSV